MGVALAIAAASLLAGCYTVGVVPPAGVTRIAVPFFRNDTFPFERDLEYDLTREIRTRLEQQTDCILVSDESNADAVLEGAVKSFREQVAAEDSLDRPTREFILADVWVRFRGAGSNTKVFFADTWQERVAFVAGGGRDSARGELVRRIADRVIAYALTTWE